MTVVDREAGTKRCPTCVTVKPLDEFGRRVFRYKGERRFGVMSECRVCHRASGDLRRQAKCDYLTALKLETGCLLCGYKEHPAALDFDHRPGEVKLFNVSLAPNRSWELLLAEVAKCDVLCANCHRVVTATRLQELKEAV